MGRKRSGGEKQEKKTPTKIRMIPRKHAGKITEPWAIMEKMITEESCFEDLRVCKPRLVWVKDWKADVDGIATGAQVCKASELDRNLAEESSGETVDVFIKLPESQWGTLDEVEKRHRIFHELCHVRPAKNSEGKQKRDSKDRLLWHMRRHPITAFPEEIEEFGIDRVIGHNDKVMEAIRHADRPMEKLFDAAEQKVKGGNGDSSAPGISADMRRLKLEDWDKLTSKCAEALTLAGLATVGALQDAMVAKPEYWAKDNGVGRFKTAAEAAINDLINSKAA